MTTKLKNETVRGALDEDLLSWMAEPTWKIDDDRFDTLARRLFAFQFEHCSAYRRFCAGRGIKPQSILHWTDIPSVPTGAFKEVELRCFAADQTIRTFRTSGTSGQKRGELHLDTLALYDASLIQSLRTLLFPDLDADPRNPGRMPLCILAPSEQESPHSSLSHMFDQLAEHHGSEETFHAIRNGQLDAQAVLDSINRANERSQPIALLGTAFSFVHLLDAMEEGNLLKKCPPGSRIMETGGFKGKVREVPRDELHRALSDRLGIPMNHILNQYGMTELGSQFYDSTLVDSEGPRRKMGPPWVRVRILNPVSQASVTPGEIGMVVIHDLANTGSIAAIETADLGREVLNPQGQSIGFEVLGREQDAEERGCSIAADEMLTSH